MRIKSFRGYEKKTIIEINHEESFLKRFKEMYN